MTIEQPFSNLAALEPGSVLIGKYRVERVIGQGGMGIVVAAHHIQLEQRVALKLMLPHAMLSQEAVSRFLREARAAARISSEHVARVYDVGSLESGEPYIAMEYLEGSDVARLLAAQGRLSPEQAVEYLLQACEALAEAHAAGVVHRDLKPGNLFLTQRADGQQLVKVLDFGISKVTGGSAQSNDPATRTSALMGSPLYMSPEQMGSSKSVDPRSDVWALGVVLYEMLCGSPPFNGETLPQVCGMVMNEAPPPLAERAPGLPPALGEVVVRCLQKAPAARFQSVAELAHALEPFASYRARQSIERISRVQGNPFSAPKAAVAAASVPVTGGEPLLGTHAPWGETKPPQVEQRGSVWPVVAGLSALALVGGSWWLLHRPAAFEGSGAPEASSVLPAAAAPAAAPVAVTDGAPLGSSAPASGPALEPSTASTPVAAAVAAAPSSATHPQGAVKKGPAAIAKEPPFASAPATQASLPVIPTSPKAPASNPAPAPTTSPAPATTKRSRL